MEFPSHTMAFRPSRHRHDRPRWEGGSPDDIDSGGVALAVLGGCLVLGLVLVALAMIGGAAALVLGWL